MSEEKESINNNNTSTETLQASNEKSISITFIRIIICFTLVSACFALKFKNPEAFNKLASLYNSSIHYENQDVRNLYESMKNSTLECFKNLPNYFN